MHSFAILLLASVALGLFARVPLGVSTIVTYVRWDIFFLEYFILKLYQKIFSRHRHLLLGCRFLSLFWRYHWGNVNRRRLAGAMVFGFWVLECWKAKNWLKINKILWKHHPTRYHRCGCSLVIGKRIAKRIVVCQRIRSYSKSTRWVLHCVSRNKHFTTKVWRITHEKQTAYQLISQLPW